MSAISLGPPADSLLGEVLVSRQPILDRHLLVVGQELLYHELTGDQAPGASSDVRATATVLIEGVLGLGRELLGADEEAFVNVPVSLLLDGGLLDLPTNDVVLEINHDAVDSADLRRAVIEHHAAGYRIALDGLTPADPRLSLAEDVDLVKVDVVASGEEPALELIRDLHQRGLTIVAENVEDPAAYDRVVGAGATYVQGFFFTRPRAVRGVRPMGLSSIHFALLRECAKEDVDFAELERLIRSDLTLADRFLTMIANTAQRWGEITSIHEGLIALGQRAVQRWVRLLIMSTIVRDAHPQLLVLASVRARYCEVLAGRLGSSNGLDAFATGMFSILGPDAVVEAATLATLPLSAEVRGALTGRPGPLRTLLDIQLAAEQADWSQLVLLGRELGLSSTELAAAHVDALTWGNEMAAVWKGFDVT